MAARGEYYPIVGVLMEESRSRQILEWYAKNRKEEEVGDLGVQEMRHMYKIDDDTPAEMWYTDTTVLEPWNPTEADILFLHTCGFDWL
jgi:hypothetical protein